MVKGIGVDLVDNIRFERLIDRFGNKIALKILSESELREYQKTFNKH